MCVFVHARIASFFFDFLLCDDDLLQQTVQRQILFHSLVGAWENGKSEAEVNATQCLHILFLIVPSFSYAFKLKRERGLIKQFTTYFIHFILSRFHSASPRHFLIFVSSLRRFYFRIRLISSWVHTYTIGCVFLMSRDSIPRQITISMMVFVVWLIRLNLLVFIFFF